MNRPSPSLSVIIPMFNEALRIGDSLRRVGTYLQEQPFTSEIVLVDDGSSDETFEIVRAGATDIKIPVRAFRYSRNRGKGHALKVGFAAADGDRLLFTDADLSTPIEECETLLRELDDGFDVVLGSRKMAGAQVGVHQPWLRETMGRGFTLLVRTMIADVSDATCGFKVFRRRAGAEIFSRCRVYDWSFDAEVVFLANHLGYPLKEVPVRWKHQEGTKVRLALATLTSLIGLMRIRYYAASGAYQRDNLVEVPDTVSESTPG